MIGFGILIPLWSTFPFQLIKILDIRNKIIKFGVAAVIPVLGIFKTTECEIWQAIAAPLLKHFIGTNILPHLDFTAMFGCAPPHTTTSAKSYFLYCASPMKLCYDENQQSHLKCTMRDTMLRLGSFLIKLTLLGGFQSFATPSGMHPFGSPTGEWYDPTRLWNPRQYLDNLVYVCAYAFYWNNGIDCSLSDHLAISNSSIPNVLECILWRPHRSHHVCYWITLRSNYGKPTDAIPIVDRTLE